MGGYVGVCVLNIFFSSVEEKMEGDRRLHKCFYDILKVKKKAWKQKLVYEKGNRA